MNKAVHGAVRRDLQRFLGALDSFPDGNQNRAGQLARAWANFHDQLTDHHESEHEIVWPALEAIGASTELIATMDAEHDIVADALAAAHTAMARLKSSASSTEAKAASGDDAPSASDRLALRARGDRDGADLLRPP
jgi:hemerythrin-like domain-containing protein